MLRFILILAGLLSLGGLRPAQAQRLQWSQITTFGGSDQQTGQPDVLTDMAVDAAGNVYLTGIYTFGTRMSSGPWPFEGQQEAFVAKFSPNGVFQWVCTVTGPGDERISSLCLGPNGLCYVTGEHEANATFDGGTTRLTGRGVFVACFDGQGNQTWLDTSIQCQFAPYMSGIAVAPDGSCYATGFTIDDTQFGPLSYIAPPGAFSEQVFVVKYSPSHAPEWITGSNTPGFSDVNPYGLLADSLGCYVSVEYSSGNGSILGLPIPSTSLVGQDYDAAIIALNTTGTPRWGRTITNPGYDYFGNISLKLLHIPGSKISVLGSCDSVTTFNAPTPFVLTSPTRKAKTFQALYDATTGQLDTVRVLAQGVTNTSAVGSFARGRLLESPTGTYLAGYFRGTVAFGTNRVQRTSTALFGSLMVARFNPDGSCSDVLTNRGGHGAYVTGIHQLPTGGLLVAGAFFDSLDTNLPKRYPIGFNDLFIAHLDILTGLSEAAAPTAGELQVWPNPARHSFSVQLPAAAEHYPARVEIRDVLGRLVAERQVADGGGSWSWSLEAFPPGVYLVRASWPGGTAGRRLVVER